MIVPALELRGITKRFGSVAALDAASLVVRPGTVHALLGENGAGKTTLMRVAFGLVHPDSGTILLDGSGTRLASPEDAISAGIGMVHQHFALIPTMTVAENVALGGRGLYSAKLAADRVREIGESSGLVLDPHTMVADLSVGAQQRLEIVKALARDARILILDEPTAVLAPAEIADLLARLRAFAESGRTVVIITHKLREALSVADDVTVLRRGVSVLSGPCDETSEQRLTAAILGRLSGVTERKASADRLLAEGGSPDAWPSSATRPTSTNVVVDGLPESGHSLAVFTATNLFLRDERGVSRVNDATFSIHEGEIVGIAAVEGSGHAELIRALAGRMAPTAGTLVRPAIVGFVPEDRQDEALILDFSLVENVALRDAGRVRGRLEWGAIQDRTRVLLENYDVRATDPRAPVSTLSGGNQQKLVLARELENAPAALVVENPTRGLDIQAGAAVHARLRATAAAGTAVVVHSSDLDELLALATRVLVVFAGSVREAPHDRDAVGRAMLGLSPASPHI